MKSIKIILTALLVTSLSLLTGCRNEKEKVAILKYATHPALDELENAYYSKLDSLIQADTKLKDKIIIEKFNANGDKQTAKSIAESFNYKDVKLIMTIGTPSAMAVAKTESEIPLVYGAVADPKGAGIIPSKRATGIQNAGENIIIQALQFIKIAFPKVKKIGTLYNSSEQNSVYVQNFLKKNAEKLGFELKQITINGNSQLSGVSEALCDEVDLIYSANDNTVNAGISSILSVCNKKGKPFIIGDLSTLSKGALFAVGLEYSTMGKDLATITYSLLSGKTISDFPPQSAPNAQIWLNKITMEKLKLNFPDSLITNYVSKTIE